MNLAMSAPIRIPGLTNVLGLPQPIYDAVANDPYSSGDADISVTGLLKPPRQAALQEQHEEEIVEDVADRIWSLVGQVMHGVLERANRVGIAERRLSMMVEGWKVSGGMDAYHAGGLLQDYKFVTAWKFKDGLPKDYEEQLNCYAELLRANGEDVKHLQIVGILRDWSRLEAVRTASYPQRQIVVLDVPLWPQENAQRFLRDRVVLHQQARLSLPECSPSDRWERPSVWAVMKPLRKSAVKLYDNEDDARKHAKAGVADDLYVVRRPGQSVRCENYCSVAQFCSQFKAMKEKEATP